MTKHTAILTLVAAAGLLAGCDDAVPEPNTADDAAGALTAPTATNGANDQNAGAEASEDSSNVAIDERIKNMCNLPDAYFAFDSAALTPSAKNMLDALTKCFADDGPGAGMSISIVGHTDPRGEETYNQGLGHRRAGSISKYLGTNGFASDRIETSSRGEMDATGTDREGWARDRRVEILLID